MSVPVVVVVVEVEAEVEVEVSRCRSVSVVRVAVSVGTPVGARHRESHRNAERARLVGIAYITSALGSDGLFAPTTELHRLTSNIQHLDIPLHHHHHHHDGVPRQIDRYTPIYLHLPSDRVLGLSPSASSGPPSTDRNDHRWLPTALHASHRRLLPPGSST